MSGDRRQITRLTKGRKEGLHSNGKGASRDEDSDLVWLGKATPESLHVTAKGVARSEVKVTDRWKVGTATFLKRKVVKIHRRQLQ